MCSEIDPELETWLLENLAANGKIIGHGYQAVVRRLSSTAGELVVKSPHPNPFLALFGRRAIRKEADMYARLAGISGIPRFYGLAAGEHLVLEHVAGPTLRQAQTELKEPEPFFARLLATIEAMHAAGVAHGDLKRKENLLVGPDETPHLIDFGIATRRGKRTRGLRRKRFEIMRQMDLNAWIKLKYGPFLDRMTPAERELYRPLWLERLARAGRTPWKILSFRRLRKRRRETRDGNA